MAGTTVAQLLEDVRLVNPDAYRIVQSVRRLARRTLPSAREEVKYGGILFYSDGVLVGGVFAYRKHVSIELAQGASIADPYQLLEGTGKERRHLRLRSPDEVAGRHVEHYLELTLRAARDAA